MSGELPKGREAMNDVIRRKVEMGIPAKKAEDQAREIARREDRRRNEK